MLHTLTLEAKIMARDIVPGGKRRRRDLLITVDVSGPCDIWPQQSTNVGVDVALVGFDVAQLTTQVGDQEGLRRLEVGIEHGIARVGEEDVAMLLADIL
jgi:hypothetical protein